MDSFQATIDVIRAAHLVFFAAGLGTALYFDFHSVRTLGEPISERVLADLRRIHVWMFAAFAGLLVTGLALIYIRTGFDLAAFSPKLWLKLGIMALLMVNAGLIGTYVMPLMRNNAGRAMADLPTRRFVGVMQVAIVSAFCWTSGLILGSSVVLKTAHWDVLLSLATGWFVILTLAGQSLALLRRKQTTSLLANAPLGQVADQ